MWRARGGARVKRSSLTLQPGNRDLISAASIPRTLGFQGLLNRKSYHKMMPPGLVTRTISAAIRALTEGSSMEVKRVNWETRSNEASEWPEVGGSR